MPLNEQIYSVWFTSHSLTGYERDVKGAKQNKFKRRLIRYRVTFWQDYLRYSSYPVRLWAVPVSGHNEMKSPRQKWKHRKEGFERGRHPDSLANLRGNAPLYEVRKLTFSIGLTPSTKDKLKKIAEKNKLSFSEVIERISRSLSDDDIEKLLADFTCVSWKHKSR